ncbi:MAG: transposase [Saprospiraceae bacterium]
MKYNPRFHHRRSMRLRGYNYAKAGSYFVTAVCKNRQPIFGEIQSGKMILSEFGQIAFDNWYQTPLIRPNVELGEFVVMPDHIHGIINIKENRGLQKLPANPVFKSPSQTLGAILRGFMASVTSKINSKRNSHGEKVWQRNYNDKVIRNKWSYFMISKYIRHNPKKWKGNL